MSPAPVSILQKSRVQLHVRHVDGGGSVFCVNPSEIKGSVTPNDSGVRDGVGDGVNPSEIKGSVTLAVKIVVDPRTTRVNPSEIKGSVTPQSPRRPSARRDCVNPSEIKGSVTQLAPAVVLGSIGVSILQKSRVQLHR